VVAREEDIRDVPAPELRGSRVLRVLEAAFKLGGEALERTRLLLDRSGQPARDRVDEHHRGEVAVREDVRPD